MRSTPTTLASRLKKRLDSTYLIFGSETLLVEESSDQVHQLAKQNGVEEVIRLTAGLDLDWQQFFEMTRSISLFSTKRLIEIRFPTGKLTSEGSKVLLSYLEEKHDDIILLLISGPIEKRAQASSWFKEIDKKGVIVEAANISSKNLVEWIRGRFLSKGLQINPEVAGKLAFYFEGNLIVAAQEVEKLSFLLHDGEEINDDVLNQYISEHAKFSIYEFIDSCLKGSGDRSLRILGHLRRDSIESIVIIWALARETRQLLEMSQQINGGMETHLVLKQYRVWSSRIQIVKAVLGRHHPDYWKDLLIRLSELDQIAKGRRLEVGSIWNNLESMVISISGVDHRFHLTFCPNQDRMST